MELRLAKESALVRLTTNGSAIKRGVQVTLTNVGLLYVLMIKIAMELRNHQESATATMLMIGMQITQLAN